MATLSWTAGTGQTVELTVRGSVVDVRVAGKLVGSHTPQEFTRPTGPGNTIVGVVGNVGLTRERYDALTAAMTMTHADLMERRRELVRAVNGAEQDAHDRETARIEAARMIGIYPAACTTDAAVAAARTALDDFDVAHPEILPAIEAERAARVARAD